MAEYALDLSEQEVERFRTMAARARVEEAQAWETAGIVTGAAVADVGCGPGAALLEMADVVGPHGSVVGVDADPAAVAVARRLVDQAGVTWARVDEGQADGTGLAPGSVDVAVLRHVLAHNGGREQAIVRHLAGLVRPAGCVYLVDVDMTAWRLLGAEPDAVDIMERYVLFHRARGNDTQIGLRLGALLRQAGLEVVEHRGTCAVLPVPVGLRPPPWVARHAMVREGVATQEDVARWQVALERLDAAVERPTMFLSQFTATGRRPG